MSILLQVEFWPQITKNPWIIAFGQVWFLAKMWCKLNSIFRTSFESSFDADHNGTIPASYLIHIPRHNALTLDTQWEWLSKLHVVSWARNKIWSWDLYHCDQHELSFQVMSILLQVEFWPFGRVWFSAKMWPILKTTYRTSFESSFDADHNGTIPSFISHSHTEIHTCTL